MAKQIKMLCVGKTQTHLGPKNRH